jgi:hypothetical protein
MASALTTVDGFAKQVPQTSGPAVPEAMPDADRVDFRK